MSSLSRRRFLQVSAAASTAFPLFTIAGTKASGKVIGANDTVRIGVAGCGGRGSSHVSEWTSAEKVQITYLIDPDKSQSARKANDVEKRQKTKPKEVQNIHKALEDKELDAVSIATCNHWHSLITIWACQAGKDVYVEKPISHNVFEGRKCVEAAKKYNRVVQHGTQSRSSLNFARAVAAVHSGKYGKLLVSKGSPSKPGSGRWSIGYQPLTPPPADFDFDLWLGPAPLQPFHKNLHPYNWHWFWDTGNGEIGNQGVHQMDIARWGIKGGTLPTKVFSIGGRFLFDGPDQAQTPNMQLAVMEFGEAILLFEVRGLTGKHPDFPQDVSNIFYTSEGVIKQGARRGKGDKSKGEGEGGYMFYPKSGGDPQKLEVPEPKITVADAFPAFINAIRTRKPEDNNCDAEVAHYSAACCHLPNISYRLGEGKPGNYDAARKAVGDNKEVVASLERIRDNCKACGLPIDGMTYTIGPVLTFDPATEKFTGEHAEAANKLLTRDYRAPYVVPASV